MHYQYDKIGNLTKDVANGISYIAWTSFGKISKITNNQGDINFAYDALGRRIKKENKSTGIITYTTYDASGNIMGIYEAKPDLTQTPNYNTLSIRELPIYGSSRIGVIHSDTKLSYIKNEIPISFANLVPSNPNKVLSIKYLYCNREFELTNHLGNVQVTISDKRIRIPNPNNNQQTAYYLPEVLTTTDYYPFGMQMPSRTFSATNGVTYKFGFNGQLEDNEITGVDGSHTTAEFWEYDSRIGRRWNVEPLIKKYPYLSPYCTYNNNPMYLFEIFGKDGEFSIVGNTITYSTKIVIIGDGATKEKAKQMQADIMKTFQGDHKETVDGVEYNVKFDIKVVTVDERGIMTPSTNIVRLKNVDPNLRGWVSGWYGRWSLNDRKSYAHEVGHFLGLADRYKVFKHIGASNWVYDEDKIYTVNADNTDDDDFMGKNACSSGAKISSNEIKALITYAVKNQKNGNGTVATGTINAPKDSDFDKQKLSNDDKEYNDKATLVP